MSKQLVFSIAAVVVIGVLAQLLARRLRVASILLLLAAGFAIGPVWALAFGKPWIDPDAPLGDVLLPFVSLSVALILYEGGMTLRLRELRGAGNVLWRLVTIGAGITWILSAVAAMAIIGLPPALAVLLGAVLVVTGPTVVKPLLREIRPKGAAGAIVKWEGIVIDPIGAMLAVLVYEAITVGGVGAAATHVVMIVVKTAVIGGGLGFIAGFGLALLLRSYRIPDDMVNPVSLMLVLAVYATSEQWQSESGLLAATVMGITLANQRLADVHHIAEFKENLQILLLAALFVLLSARVKPEALAAIGWRSVLFVAALIVIVRPLSVLASTVGSSLTWPQRMFIMLMAPRGIVAASVAAVFALEMASHGYEGAGEIVPLTFLTIVGTVLFSSLVVPIVARRLGVSEPSPQGVLFAGANSFARGVAAALQKLGFRCVLVDTNRENAAAARMAGLETVVGNIVGEDVLDDVDLAGIGRLIAATPNNAVNMLAAKQYARVFGRREVYQIAPPASGDRQRAPDVTSGARILGSRDVTWSQIADRLNRGFVVKTTPLTESFTLKDFRQRYGEQAIPLMLVASGGKRLTMLVDDAKVEPAAGQALIALAPDSGNGNHAASDKPASVSAT